jgi:hypothetical protein
MSLTRQQWIELWNHVCNIEHAAKFLKSPPTKQTILWEVKKIKEMIESVIGQME